LAKQYNTTQEAIIEASDLDNPHMLTVGRELVIPVRPNESASPAAPTQANPGEETASATYTVRRGDTLGAIAAKFGVTVQKLMEDNDIANERLLQVGQVLLIKGEPPRTPSPEEVEITHTVRPGESLASIAAQYRRTVRSIMDANAITSTKSIQAGQELLIPPVTPTPELLEDLPIYSIGEGGYRYSAPVALAPPHGTIFWGADTAILLNWVSVGILEEDEWYLVTLNYLVNGEREAAREWTKATSWRLSEELHPPAEAETRTLVWDVAVVRRAPSPSNIEEGEILSPRSRPREFTWN
jgi:LysM repeat protein